jgi:hypothetical protein
MRYGMHIFRQANSDTTMHYSIIGCNPFLDSDSVPLLEACESNGIIGAYETPSPTPLGARASGGGQDQSHGRVWGLAKEQTE